MSLEERFWLKVQKTDDGCWLWTGQIERNGYGRISAGGAQGRMLMVHRVAYELMVGPIPEGLEIDHVKGRGCVHRNCVRPDHLEPVTHRENCLRARPAALADRCGRGHAYTPENTRLRPGGARACKECQRIYNAARRRRAAA